MDDFRVSSNEIENNGGYGVNGLDGVNNNANTVNPGVSGLPVKPTMWSKVKDFFLGYDFE